MKHKQRIELRQSETRERMNELLSKEEKTAEDLQELNELSQSMKNLETEKRAAILAEGEDLETREETQPLDNEQRERLELRSKASLTNYVGRYMAGKLPQGVELELQQAAKVDGIPIELWDIEQRADAVTGAPATVGVNLDTIRPMVFAKSIAPRLGIDMPRVESGTYATATITKALTAGAKAKGAAQEATAAEMTVSTATPKRVSARLSIALEDVAAVGAQNFENVLRENLSLVLSDELDKQALNGDGSGANLTGIFERLTNPAAPAAGVVNWEGFAKQHAAGIDGLWSNTLMDVSIVVNPETYRLAASTFQGTDSELSAAAYAGKYTGGFWTNKRMPDKTNHIAQAILYRKGREGLRVAVCPHWGQVSIDDIYSGSSRGERYVTFHVLLGDVLLVQPDAFEQVAYRVSS
ncbi:MAG: hypothetical protein F4X63_09235 [Nitrospira sp. SB0662_bin_26]|nr:hypothetical protein [Nitrospira sp. SB0662_bin_26]